MELPIAQQSYAPSDEALVRAARRKDVILARTVAEEAPLSQGVAFTNQELSELPWANGVLDLAHEQDGATDGPNGDGTEPGNAILAEIDAHFAEAGTSCLRVVPMDEAMDPSVAAALEAAGFVKQTTLLHRMYGYSRPDAIDDALQVIPARAAFAEARSIYHDQYEQAGRPWAKQAADALVDFLDDTRLQVLLARSDGRPVGVLGVISIGQIGVVHNPYVVPSARDGAVLGTLIDRLIDYCTRSQFEQVLIAMSEDDVHREAFKAVGFGAVATLEHYARAGA